MKMTDIHAHFVYGVDDGASTYEMMCAMLDRAQENGIAHLVSTPHMTPGVEKFNDGVYRQHLNEAREYCEHKGYAITLYAGAELLYTPMLDGYLRNHSLIASKPSGKVLLEFSPQISLKEIEHALTVLKDAGYDAILAHAERYKALNRVGALSGLRNRFPNLGIQVNANTVLNPGKGLYGLMLKHWLKSGLVDYIASDAHNIATRPFNNRLAYNAAAELCGKDRARAMFGYKA